MKKRTKTKSPLEIYVDVLGDHRWRLVARNGRGVADSGEGYTSAAKARAGFRSAAKLAAQALKQLDGGK